MKPCVRTGEVKNLGLYHCSIDRTPLYTCWHYPLFTLPYIWKFQNSCWSCTSTWISLANDCRSSATCRAVLFLIFHDLYLAPSYPLVAITLMLSSIPKSSSGSEFIDVLELVRASVDVELGWIWYTKNGFCCLFPPFKPQPMYHINKKVSLCWRVQFFSACRCFAAWIIQLVQSIY